MVLLFDQTRIPRATPRAQWREMDRWRRVTTKKLREIEVANVDAIVGFGQDFGTYGSATLELAVRAADHLANPTVLLGPHQE